MTRRPFPEWAKRLFRVLLPVLILGGGVIGARALVATRPAVKKVAQQASATIVEVITVRSEDIRAVISAFGTVRAHQELSVQPQVSGSVVEQHAKLIKGGLLHAGEVLLRIDQRDYAYAVETQRGTLAKAEFQLDLERGNQVIAQREWDLLESSIETSEMGKQLALRKPHLREKRAAVAAAKSRLAKAELDLQRTTLTAPCNALVLDESVEVGQLVMSQTPVARLVCTDAFRVEVSIPMHELAWVEIPGPTRAQGSQVRVIRDLGSDKTAQRQGVVAGLLGDVSENGRMARLLVLVEDPMSRTTPHDRQLPLLLGEYVRVEIDGPQLTDVFVVPRNTLREGGRVWVKNGDNQLEIRQVEVALSRHDSLLIQSGLQDGDQVITSPLPVALSGMAVQSSSESPPSSASPPMQPAEPSPPAADEGQGAV